MNPGWKERGSLIVPDYDPIFDIEPARFQVKIKGFQPLTRQGRANKYGRPKAQSEEKR